MDFLFTGFTLKKEIEIATPREGSGKTATSLNEMMVMGAVDSSYSHQLMAESMQTKRETAFLMAMFSYKQEGSRALKGVPTFLLSDVAGREAFLEASGLDQKSLFWNDSKLIDTLGEKFPKGVVLKAKSQVDGEEEMFISFPILRRMTSVGGTMEGVGAEILGVITYAIDPGNDSGVDQKFTGKLAHISAGIEAWLSQVVESHAILKRLMTSWKGSKVGGKIRTASCFPILNQEAGELPKLGMSIADDRLKELAKLPDGSYNPKYLKKVRVKGAPKKKGGKKGKKVKRPRFKWVFDPALMHQEVFFIGRAPMPMKTPVEVILMELEGYPAPDPGTDIMLGDAFGWLSPNEGTDSRILSMEEMLSLREGSPQHPVSKEMGLSFGWGPSNEGDSDGDGDELENPNR